MCRWADTKKATKWLSEIQTNTEPRMSKINGSAAKVIKSFENNQNLTNEELYSLKKDREYEDAVNSGNQIKAFVFEETFVFPEPS